MSEKLKPCLCTECTHLDWVDVRVYGNLAWCKIEHDKHQKPRSVIDDSYCKNFRQSKSKTRLLNII